MPHLCVSELCQHWFRYGNQCCLIVNWTLRNKFSEILIKIPNVSFIKMHLKMSSAKLRPFLSGWGWGMSETNRECGREVRRSAKCSASYLHLTYWGPEHLIGSVYCWHFPMYFLEWILLYIFIQFPLKFIPNDLLSIGSDNGLTPNRRQATIWTNGGLTVV